jgi:hypothetical protein
MADSLLTDLVRRQTAGAVLATFSRTIDVVAEQLAQDILRDPEFREEMRALVRTAFRDTLQSLTQPPVKP